jgi:hypothetical protein
VKNLPRIAAVTALAAFGFGAFGLPATSIAGPLKQETIIVVKEKTFDTSTAKGQRMVRKLDRKFEKLAAKAATRGNGNTASVAQSGTGNRAGVAQYGSNSSVSIDQAGNANAAYVIQRTNGAALAVSQTGQSQGYYRNERKVWVNPPEPISAAASRNQRNAHH